MNLQDKTCKSRENFENNFSSREDRLKGKVYFKMIYNYHVVLAFLKFHNEAYVPCVVLKP